MLFKRLESVAAPSYNLLIMYSSAVRQSCRRINPNSSQVSVSSYTFTSMREL